MSQSEAGTTPQSFRGYVGIAKQTDFSTGASPSIFVDAVSDGFSYDNQPDLDENTRARGHHKAEAGPLDASGSVDMPVNPENGIGLLLLSAFGGESFTSPQTDVGEHTFTPSDTLPFLSVEVDRDTDVVRNVGCGVDSLELSHTSEDKLTASVDMTARTPDTSVSSSSPTYSDLRNFRFSDATVTFGGTDRSTDVQDVSVSIENNLEGYYRDERVLAKMGIGERVVTVTATLDFESTTLFDTFLNVSDGTPGDTLQETSFTATWTSPEVIGTSSTNYALEWNSPRCVIDTSEASINQDDLVAHDVELTALVDSGIGAEAEVTLTNGVTDAY